MFTSLIVGVIINSQQESLETQLSRAIVLQKFELARELLSKGADPNNISKHEGSYRFRRSAMYRVCYERPDDYRKPKEVAKMLEILIQYGGKVNDLLEPYQPYYPLQMACANAHVDNVKVLIKHGAIIDLPITYPPLICAIRSPNSGFAMNVNPVRENRYVPMADEVIEILLEAGANPNTAVKEHGNALQMVVYHDRINQVRLFLKHGADPNLRRQETVEDLPTSMRHFTAEDFVDYMNRSSGDKWNPFQYTALHVAALTPGKNKAEITKLLLDAGADPSLEDALERTPLEIALKKKNAEVVKVLREYDQSHKTLP